MKINILKSLPFIAILATSNTAAQPNEANIYGDLRLRYETVAQDNALPDADALTLRTRLGVKTADYEGFSAVIEAENSVSIIDNFAVPPTGDRTGEFSVIADPDHLEIDQAFVQYKSEKWSAKVGRQVFTLGGHRFVGHVGFRQDRQTFDAVVVSARPAEGFTIDLSYIDKRNRIFSDDADIDSKDTILNSSYALPFGKLTGYAYLLEADDAPASSIDTYGVSLSGSQKIGDHKLSYNAEIATQESADMFDTEYLWLEVSMGFGGIKAKVGYELLGSDDGQRGFATPLATLHKFNGWADQFLATPNQGLQDVYLGLSGKLAGGKWAAVYHDFSADEELSGADDLGSELNLVYSRKFTDSVSAGVKFADYSAGDEAFSKVDTEKFWAWVGFNFK